MRAGAAIAAVSFALAASAAGAAAAHGEERAFALVVGAKPPSAPATLAARKGDAVAIALRSETAAEVHLHGYNLEARLEAGGTATWRFTAHATGRYPINVHAPGTGSGHRHAPPVAYLEVRPR
ncbi:MAG: hypothetical protein U1F37_13225 [Alphaproteobacteria bacterium]